jgi:hypothetical protein
MPIVEDRSSRTGKRSRTRRLTTVPGLASLLADVSRERFLALARVWSVPAPDSPGTAAVLYRSMTTYAAIDGVQARLGDPARLVFGRLAARSGPVRQSTVAKLVPFADDELEVILAQLREAGLIWTIQPPGQTDGIPEIWWVVPRDIARSSRAVPRPTPQPRDRELRESSVVPSHEGDLVPLASDPPRIARLEVATRIIDRVLAGEALLAIMSEANPERVRDAAHLGVAMGVLEVNGRVFTPGLRSIAWMSLAEPERIRALTRMWSVDETGPNVVPVVVRRGVLAALRTAEPGRWYDANAVARLAALPISPSPSGSVPSSGGDDRNRVTIDRASVDRAVVALAVIGANSVVLDRRERPTAVRLTDAGFQAIR